MTHKAPNETHIRADAPYKYLWEALVDDGRGPWHTTTDLAEALSRACGTAYKAARVRGMLDVLERLGAVRCRHRGRNVTATRVEGVCLEFEAPETHITAPEHAACAYHTRYTLRLTCPTPKAPP